MARSFDGSTQYISRSPVITAMPCSMASWAYFGVAASNESNVTSASPSTIKDLYSIITDNTSHLCAKIASASVADQTAATSATVSINTWYHTAAVFTSSTSRAICINGGGKVTSSVSCSPNSANFNITSYGVAKTSGGVFFKNVKIAFPAYWTAALTDSEVLALASGISPIHVRPQSLVSYLRLTGGNSNEPDMVTATTFATTGGVTEFDNPSIYAP
jgi:hypothetical protein